MEFGVPLSNAEVAELTQRREIAAGLEPLTAAIETDARFGGLYTVQSEGGRIHIGVTRQDPTFTDTVERLLPAGARYVLEPMTFSYSELTALRAQIHAQFSELREEFGVKHLGIDQRANRVEIGIHPYVDELAAGLRGRFGPAVNVVESG